MPPFCIRMAAKIFTTLLFLVCPSAPSNSIWEVLSYEPCCRLGGGQRKVNNLAKDTWSEGSTESSCHDPEGT